MPDLRQEFAHALSPVLDKTYLRGTEARVVKEPIKPHGSQVMPRGQTQDFLVWKHINALFGASS